MKKTLLALALLAFTGSAAFAHEGHDKEKGGKKGKKKEACAAEAKAHCSKEGSTATLGATPNCCTKKGAKAEAAVVPATAPAAKSL